MDSKKLENKKKWEDLVNSSSGPTFDESRGRVADWDQLNEDRRYCDEIFGDLKNLARYAARKNEQYQFLIDGKCRDESRQSILERLKNIKPVLVDLVYGLVLRLTESAKTIRPIRSLREEVQREADESASYLYNEALIKYLRKLTFDVHYRKLEDGAQILDLLITNRNGMYQIDFEDLIFRQENILKCRSISELRKAQGISIKRSGVKSSFPLVFRLMAKEFGSRYKKRAKESLDIENYHQALSGKLNHAIDVKFCGNAAANEYRKNLHKNKGNAAIIRDCFVAHGFSANTSHIKLFKQYPELRARRDQKSLIFAGIIMNLISHKYYFMEHHPNRDTFDPVSEGHAVLRKKGASKKLVKLLLNQGPAVLLMVARMMVARTMAAEDEHDATFRLDLNFKNKIQIAQENKSVTIDFEQGAVFNKLNCVAESLLEKQEYPLTMWRSLMALRTVFTRHGLESLQPDSSKVVVKNINRFITIIANQALLDKRKKRLKSNPYWKGKAFNELEDYLMQSPYLNPALERTARNIVLPKNSTLEGLLANSDEWHEAIHLENQAKIAAEMDVNWVPIIRVDQQRDSLEIEVIDNALRLYNEGKEMHHCVYSYLSRCQTGFVTIVSIKDKENKKKRSTLAIVGKPGQFRIQQHTSYCNEKPPANHLLVAKQICIDLNTSEMDFGEHCEGGMLMAG